MRKKEKKKSCERRMKYLCSLKMKWRDDAETRDGTRQQREMSGPAVVAAAAVVDVRHHYHYHCYCGHSHGHGLVLVHGPAVAGSGHGRRAMKTTIMRTFLMLGTLLCTMDVLDAG
jgi:hypothetical protein